MCIRDRSGAALRVTLSRDLPRLFPQAWFSLSAFKFDGTLLPQSSGVPSGSLLWRASPRLLPEAWFAGFIVHPCTRCSQGSPFGSTYGGYNSTCPKSRFSALVQLFAFRFSPALPPAYASSFLIFQLSAFSLALPPSAINSPGTFHLASRHLICYAYTYEDYH